MEDNKKFAESLELDYPILSDPEGKVAEAFGVVNKQRRLPMRWTFFINKEGVVAHIDKRVSARSHGADIAAKLKELGVEPAEQKKE